MSVADDLYLIFLNYNKQIENKVIDWEANFQWLKDVETDAKKNRGQTIIPKTPGRKPKRRKIADEKIDFLPPAAPLSEVGNVQGTLRKSSRAAAKQASERTRVNIIEQSNISSKLRQPSTPPKASTTISSGSKRNVHIEVFIEKLECTPPKNLAKDSGIGSENPYEGEESNLRTSQSSQNEEIATTYILKTPEKIEEPEIMEVESTCSISNLEELLKPMEVEQILMPPPMVEELLVCSAETKQKLETEVLEERPVRSTRTKQKQETEDLEERPVRSTRTKQKQENDDLEEMPVRSTRTKQKQETEVLEEGPVHTTQTKQRQETEDLEERPVRTTRTKQRQETEIAEDRPIRSTRTKQREVEPEENQEVIEPPKRFTRSKMKPPPQNSPAPKTPTSKCPFSRECCTPKSDNKIIDEVKAYTPNSPFKTKKNKPKLDLSDVEEVRVPTSGSSQLVRQHTKTMSVKVNKMKNLQSFQTPPMSSNLHKSKIHGLFSAGRSNSSSLLKSKKIPLSSASPNISRSRALGTPTEINRTRNLVSGVSSFISKAHPTKANKEEQKREEQRRRQEKMEEAQMKKEEALKLKAEEQKRKNDERQRKVQEARIARDKKATEDRKQQEKERKAAAEDRKQQERERKMRDERQKKDDERKKRLAKEQEANKIREQEELVRQKEEQRQLDEQHRKKCEEEKLLRLEEEKRLKAEKQRLIRQEEQDRIKEKRRQEQERIDREKRELQLLKEKEALAAKQNPNDETFTAEKPSDATFVTSEAKSDSYEMTPQPQKKTKKIVNPDNYDIGDLKSDESTDEEMRPKKEIPSWAKGENLRIALKKQQYDSSVNLDDLFRADSLLLMPDLTVIFKNCKMEKRIRFNKRTSSANWNTPPYKVFR